MIRLVNSSNSHPKEPCFFCKIDSMYHIEFFDDLNRFKSVPICKTCFNKLKAEFANLTENSAIDLFNIN